MAGCRLYLLGPPHLETDVPVGRIRLKKAVALLAYLAVERRPFSREYLAALLWPDHNQRSAMANVRRTLSQIREALFDGCLVTQGDQVSIDGSLVSVDVDDFHALIQVAASNGEVERMESAAGLYRGSFLEGFNLGRCAEFDEWQDAVRLRLEEELDELLENLCRIHLENDHPKAALPFARRRLELDSLNEAAHRAIAQVHSHMGRRDLARRQLESCLALLEREGLDPDSLTLRMHDEVDHPATVVPSRGPGTGEPQKNAPSGERERPVRARQARVPPAPLRRGAPGVVGAFAAALFVATWFALIGMRLLGYYGEPDLHVRELEVFQNGERLSEVRAILKIEGPTFRSVDYAVTMSGNAVIGEEREFVVYRGGVRPTRSAEVRLRVSAADLLAYVEANSVRIPPGSYTVTIVMDPGSTIRESNEANNTTWALDTVFFLGSVAMEIFEVDIQFQGGPRLTESYPLAVFIGDPRESVTEWARFRVTRQGLHYLPLEYVPRPDFDGSGYAMLLIHDAGNDLRSPLPEELDGDDVAGLYKEVVFNIVYGAFNPSSGSPMFPNRRYSVLFVSPPPMPVPDRYETDDDPADASVITLGDAPVRQYHTFDLEGDRDEDWFAVALRAGETIVVETESAGGRWEAETQIDINSATGHLGSGRRESVWDNYSELAFVNDAGTDATFFICIAPYVRTLYWKEPVGEYMVEFRRQ